MEAMGADDRLPAAALIASLTANPQRFDLFQAISLLERAAPWARPLGHGNGAGEAIRLSGFVSLAFEPSDIRSVRLNPLLEGTMGTAATTGGASSASGTPGPHYTPRQTYTVSTPVLTLAGANGPLPMPFTEMVLARRAARDHATADLLDIFNHRFLSFLYRSRKKHAPGLNWRAPDASALASCLDALSNLGLRGGVRGPQGAHLWMRHAGLLGAAPRSMTGLLAMLSDRLDLRMRGAQFVGCWRAIDARDSLRIARTGSAAPRLGGTSVLGRRTWDQAGGIRVELLDLTRERFAALLPGGRDHELAAWLIRCYVQQDLDVQFVLNLAPQRTACVLGGASASRLGWTSWVAGAHGSTSPDKPVQAPAPVRVALRAAAAVPAPVRHH
jgi:type VI secretion system protein ImpH